MTSKVAKAFLKAKIIPLVVQTPPRVGIYIKYNERELHEGNKLTPKETKEQPKISWCASPGYFYSIFMIDPDAPSPRKPVEREWLHWFVGNCTGNELTTGEVLCEYVGAAPPENTDFHRYVFLLFRHTSKIEFNFENIPNTSVAGRPCFKMIQFAHRFKLGEVHGGNYFLAEYDETVPETYKQLGL